MKPVLQTKHGAAKSGRRKRLTLANEVTKKSWKRKLAEETLALSPVRELSAFDGLPHSGTTVEEIQLL